MKIKMKTKLIRIDLNLKYLVIESEDKKYTESDVLEWLHNIHSGELDGDDVVSISEINNKNDVEDFDIGYAPYNNVGDDYISLSEYIEDNGLDAQEMINKLKKLGYSVTKKK